MIDTHCHLYLDEFKTDIDQVIKRATENGVTRFYMPAIDSNSLQAMFDMEVNFRGMCKAMIGLHPCSVKENYMDELNFVTEWLDKRKFAAIGESGLDFYWDKTYIKQQYDALERQIELALSFKLPIILHTRNSTRETIDVIRNFSGKGLAGIFHCFGGSLKEAEQIIEEGFFLGIGGVVTYKNSGLDKVVEQIGLEHIVLETDSPYLAPVPYRGKRNDSSYLPIIALKLAEIKNVPVSEIDAVTSANAEKIFGKQ